MPGPTVDGAVLGIDITNTYSKYLLVWYDSQAKANAHSWDNKSGQSEDLIIADYNLPIDISTVIKS